jgi:Mg2+ and Co2+ transporter CorA
MNRRALAIVADRSHAVPSHPSRRLAAELGRIGAQVDDFVATMRVIEPTKDVILKTLSMYQVKSLQPFDEMIMGAVLTRAEELVQRGEADLYFCNLNKKDFDPTNRPELAAEYDGRKMK